MASSSSRMLPSLNFLSVRISRDIFSTFSLILEAVSSFSALTAVAYLPDEGQGSGSISENSRSLTCKRRKRQTIRKYIAQSTCHCQLRGNKRLGVGWAVNVDALVRDALPALELLGLVGDLGLECGLIDVVAVEPAGGVVLRLLALLVRDRPEVGSVALLSVCSVSVQVRAPVSVPAQCQEQSSSNSEHWENGGKKDTQRQRDDLRMSRTLQGEGTSCVAHLPAPMEVARARPDVVAAAVLVDHLATAVLLRVRRVRELKPATESSGRDDDKAVTTPVTCQ